MAQHLQIAADQTELDGGNTFFIMAQSIHIHPYRSEKQRSTA
jgi:hypothetical protein